MFRFLVGLLQKLMTLIAQFCPCHLNNAAFVKKNGGVKKISMIECPCQERLFYVLGEQNAACAVVKIPLHTQTNAHMLSKHTTEKGGLGEKPCTWSDNAE